VSVFLDARMLFHFMVLSLLPVFMGVEGCCSEKFCICRLPGSGIYGNDKNQMCSAPNLHFMAFFFLAELLKETLCSTIFKLTIAKEAI